MNLAQILISLFKKDLAHNIKIASIVEFESKAKLKLIQEEKFNKLIKHSKSNVPYYKNKLGGISGVEDISKIDFLTKENIRNNINKLKSKNIDKERFILKSTSGSTGESLSYYVDAKNYYRKAVGYRCDGRSGYKIGSKALYLWGADRDIIKKKSIYKSIKDKYIHKEKRLSTYHMSSDDIIQYTKIYNKFNPDVIIAYPSPLYHFANYIEKHKIKLQTLEGIITSAETLFPFQRKKIEEVFKCKIFNRYGCREFGNIASECEAHNGLHLNTDRFIVEIINSDGEKCKNGELGEIVITDLDEYTFPMIRYKIGDLGIISGEDCSCGRSLPILKTVEGRVFDLIIGSNGNMVGGTFWTLLKHKLKGWSKFQIIQEKESQVEIIVENNNEIESGFKDSLTKLVKEKLGEEMEITIKLVDKIALTKTGKHRWIVSKISPYV